MKNKIKNMSETEKTKQEQKLKSILKEKDELFVKIQNLVNKFEKKTKKSDLKFKILQSAGKYLYQGRHMVFCFMASNEKSYSIRLMCEVLDIHRCTYRRWKNGYITERQKRKSLLQKEITYIFFAFKERYGCPRITIELQNAGYKISCTTVYEYMKELGLSSKVKKNK